MNRALAPILAFIALPVVPGVFPNARAELLPKNAGEDQQKESTEMEKTDEEQDRWKLLPEEAQNNLRMLIYKFDWFAASYGAARRRAIGRHSSKLTGEPRADWKVRAGKDREMSELDTLGSEVQTEHRNVYKAISAIESVANEPEALRVESQKQHAQLDQAIEKMGKELVRIENHFDPIEPARSFRLAPVSLGEPATELPRRESGKVETLVGQAIYDMWRKFHDEQEDRKAKEREKLGANAADPFATRPNVRFSRTRVNLHREGTFFEFRTYFSKKTDEPQAVDRIRGTISVKRDGRVGELGILAFSEAKVRFIHKPKKDPTIAIRGEFTILLTQHLKVDEREISAGSLLTRVGSRRWSLQSSLGSEKADPVDGAG